MVNDLFPLGDWVRHHALRSWPVILFLLLICVPSIALVVLGSPTKTTFDVAAWLFAAYYAVAWLLLLGVIIRPDHVTRPMLPQPGSGNPPQPAPGTADPGGSTGSPVPGLIRVR